MLIDALKQYKLDVKIVNIDGNVNVWREVKKNNVYSVFIGV